MIEVRLWMENENTFQDPPRETSGPYWGKRLPAVISKSESSLLRARKPSLVTGPTKAILHQQYVPGWTISLRLHIAFVDAPKRILRNQSLDRQQCSILNGIASLIDRTAHLGKPIVATSFQVVF